MQHSDDSAARAPGRPDAALPALETLVDAQDYVEHFRLGYSATPYYSSGRDWNDYLPAYRYGFDTYQQHAGQQFDEVEALLSEQWDRVKPPSRLAWAEARDAVLDGWRCISQALPRRSCSDA